MFDGSIVEESTPEAQIPFDAIRVTLNNGKKFKFVSNKLSRWYANKYCQFNELNEDCKVVKEFCFPRENVMLVEVIPCSSYDEANNITKWGN